MKQKHWRWRGEGVILGLAMGLLLGQWDVGDHMGEILRFGLAPFAAEHREGTLDNLSEESHTISSTGDKNEENQIYLQGENDVLLREEETFAGNHDENPDEIPNHKNEEEGEETEAVTAEVFATGSKVTALLNEFLVIPEGLPAADHIFPNQTKILKATPIDRSVNGPQILIYHTHSQEAFADSEPGNMAHTVVGLGNRLAAKLSGLGFRVYHDTGSYDLAEDGLLDRSKAYERALPQIEDILQQYPTIQLVIDLHRDGVEESIHLVTEVEEKPTARIMLVNGLAEETEGGNPFLEENLGLSLQLMEACKTTFPGFTRSVYVKSGTYNQNLCRSLLLEVGAQTNTVAEAQQAVDFFGEILGKTLFGY